MTPELIGLIEAVLILVAIVVVIIAAIVVQAKANKRYDERARANPPPPKPRVVPWYEQVGELISIRSYDSPTLATADANLAAAFGWSVQSVATTDGHINLGRTVAGMALTGGVSLLAGGSRSQGQVTVTFTRVPVAVVA